VAQTLKRHVDSVCGCSHYRRAAPCEADLSRLSTVTAERTPREGNSRLCRLTKTLIASSDAEALEPTCGA